MESPVLFIIFMRPDTTRRVFERIREAQPPKLYIAADGPRKEKEGEAEKCSETREIVKNIDWPCEVYRLYREENLGCGKGVSSAITWFFQHEEQGIIIEDDILPHVDFFKYCDEMLERYKEDQRIQLISGFNYFYDGYQSPVSYYMSCFMSIWGWASWRRVWETYEFDVKELDKVRLKKQLYKQLPRKSAQYFMGVYRSMLDFGIDTWDFQFFLNQQYYGRYSIASFVNLVENIGMGVEGSAHNATTVNDIIVKHKAKSPYPIRHPKFVRVDNDADYTAMLNNGQYKNPWYVNYLNSAKRRFAILFR